MNRFILAVALAAGFTLASAAPAVAAAKNYDCSKPGNANKAACKGAVASAAKVAAKPGPAKAAASAKPTATKVSSTTTTKTLTERTYECSKPGNRKKAMCNSAAAATAAKPLVEQKTVATSVRHYDCTKPGNAKREQCKVSTSNQQAASRPIALPKQATASAPARPRKIAAAASVDDHNPAGALATCKDGSYSHAKARSGACARHGGVAKWM
jgi:hypothetical protein